MLTKYSALFIWTPSSVPRTATIHIPYIDKRCKNNIWGKMNKWQSSCRSKLPMLFICRNVRAQRVWCGFPVAVWGCRPLTDAWVRLPWFLCGHYHYYRGLLTNEKKSRLVVKKNKKNHLQCCSRMVQSVWAFMLDWWSTYFAIDRCAVRKKTLECASFRMCFVF